MNKEAKTVTIEDAQLIFKNFKGAEQQFNREGDRNFCVVLPEDVATEMSADGWNVNWLKPREEGDLPTPYVEVAVKYKNRPPRIWMITSTGRTPLDESTVECLDMVDMELVDLIIRGYEWEVSGKSGIKAYVQSMFVTIREDDLERKYAVAPPKETFDDE